MKLDHLLDVFIFARQSPHSTYGVFALYYNGIQLRSETRTGTKQSGPRIYRQASSRTSRIKSSARALAHFENSDMRTREHFEYAIMQAHALFKCVNLRELANITSFAESSRTFRVWQKSSRSAWLDFPP